MAGTPIIPLESRTLRVQPIPLPAQGFPAPIPMPAPIATAQPPPKAYQAQEPAPSSRVESGRHAGGSRRHPTLANNARSQPQSTASAAAHAPPTHPPATAPQPQAAGSRRQTREINSQQIPTLINHAGGSRSQTVPQMDAPRSRHRSAPKPPLGEEEVYFVVLRGPAPGVYLGE